MGKQWIFHRISKNVPVRLDLLIIQCARDYQD